MALAKTFASNVRRLREKKNLTQRDIAERARISVSYVSMLERGQRTPPLEMVETMAKAMGTTPMALLGKGTPG